MKRKLLILSITALAFTSCKTEIDPFLVQSQNIGLLTDSTQVKDLDLIFTNDSIVKPIAGDEFTGKFNTIEIYEKGGKHLLSLTPSQTLDSTATIANIKIKDKRYKTEKGISKVSTFADIKENYTITSIQNSFKSASVFVKESKVFFLIDKSELPAGLRFDMSKKIEEANIPDLASIKHFMVGW